MRVRSPRAAEAGRRVFEVKSGSCCKSSFSLSWSTFCWRGIHHSGLSLSTLRRASTRCFQSCSFLLIQFQMYARRQHPFLFYQPTPDHRLLGTGLFFRRVVIVSKGSAYLWGLNLRKLRSHGQILMKCRRWHDLPRHFVFATMRIDWPLGNSLFTRKVV